MSGAPARCAVGCMRSSRMELDDIEQSESGMSPHATSFLQRSDDVLRNLCDSIRHRRHARISQLLLLAAIISTVDCSRTSTHSGSSEDSAKILNPNVGMTGLVDTQHGASANSTASVDTSAFWFLGHLFRFEAFAKWPTFLVGSKPTLLFHDEQTQLYFYPKYVVMQFPIADGVDSVVVFRRKSGSVRLSASQPIGDTSYTSSIDYHQWFAGIQGDYLFFGFNAGDPGIGDIFVYDLTTRGMVVDAEFTDAIRLCGRDSLVYTEVIEGEATKANCPKFEEWTRDLLTPRLTEVVIYNLSTRTKTRTGQCGCTAFQ